MGFHRLWHNAVASWAHVASVVVLFLNIIIIMLYAKQVKPRVGWGESCRQQTCTDIREKNKKEEVVLKMHCSLRINMLSQTSGFEMGNN